MGLEDLKLCTELREDHQDKLVTGGRLEEKARVAHVRFYVVLLFVCSIASYHRFGKHAAT